jgi:hypothetical protein
MSKADAMDNQTEQYDVDALWSDLLNDRLDASQRLKLLNHVTSDLRSEVSRRPDAAVLLDTLNGVFKERPLTEDMWPATERALLFSYGPAAARIVRWLVTDSDEVANRLDEILPMLDPDSEALLRNILTQHAEELIWSYFALNSNANEWRVINRVTRQALNGQNYYTQIDLMKVNGEQFSFQVRANQLLILAGAFLETINDHPSTAFTATDLVEYFLDAARMSVSTVSASPAAPQENEPPGATDEQTPGGTPRSPVNDENMDQSP